MKKIISDFRIAPDVRAGWLWVFTYVITAAGTLWAFSRLLTNYSYLYGYLSSGDVKVLAITISYLLTPFAELICYIGAFHLLLRKSAYSPRYACALHLVVPVVGILCTMVRLALSTDLIGAGTASVMDVLVEDLIFFGPLALVSLIFIVYLMASRRVRAYYGVPADALPKTLPTFEGTSTLGLSDKK